MIFAFQTCGEYICALLASDLLCDQLWNFRGPRQELAMGPKVGVPTLRAAEMATVDLHVLRDGATTLLASWCEALRHARGGRRPPSTRTESATII